MAEITSEKKQPVRPDYRKYPADIHHMQKF